jgi:hypothetical protein
MYMTLKISRGSNRPWVRPGADRRPRYTRDPPKRLKVRERAIVNGFRASIAAAVVLFPALASAETPIAWQEEFDSTDALKRANIYHEHRGTGKSGEPVIIQNLADGVYSFGLKYDPTRRQERLNLMYGDVCWGVPAPTDLHSLPDDPRAWGPFDTKEFPYVEIKWRGRQFALYYGLEAKNGDRRGSYTYLKRDRKVVDERGREWYTSLFRSAADSSSPTSATAVKLLGINLAAFSPGDDEQGVTEIDYIRVRGLTPKEKLRESKIVETFKDFPKTRWRGYDEFFPFGVYVGYLRSDFESWGGDYEGAYGNYVRYGFNYVSSNDEVELGRFGTRQLGSDDPMPIVEAYIKEKKKLIEAARSTGMRLGADVRRMMESRDPSEGYQPLLPIARRLCEAFADDDIIVSWKMADEPGLSRLLELACTMRALSECDALGRPQLIEFNSTAKFASFAPYLNLNCWDSYPVVETQRNAWAIRKTARSYRKLLPDAPMWAVLQSFETRPPAPVRSYIRPSDAEMRMMAYMAIAEGAKGLIWYSGWTGSGRDEGLVERAGQPRGGMMETLSDLSRRLIPIGRRLLHTDPAEEPELAVTQAGEFSGERGIAANLLKHRDADLFYVVAVNEDLDRVRSARIEFSAGVLESGYGVYDLFALDGKDLRDGSALEVANLAGGDGRVYLVGDAERFARVRDEIRWDVATESVRRLTPDLTIARRWGLDVAAIDESIALCRDAAKNRAANEATAHARDAETALFAAITNHSRLHAIRRAFEDIRIELAEVSRITEYYSKSPRWWTGRDHRMLIPNPSILDNSKEYFEIGRRYRDLYTRYLKGESEGFWAQLNETRLDCLKMRESVLAMIRKKLEPTESPDQAAAP